MRLALGSAILIFVIALLTFALGNPDTRVDLYLLGARYANIHVGVISLVAAVFGAVIMGALALIEGAAIRLTNRRLRRDLQKLETENNFLRTQKSAEQRPEPDAYMQDAADAEDLEDTKEEKLERAEERWRQGKLPSAPVYDPSGPLDPE